MIDLRLMQLRHFLLVVDTKSFRTAARLAFKSQPALSQSIRQLESRLGQPLFERRSRTTLTAFGSVCLPLIRELVAHVERSTGSMLQIAQSSGGRLAFAILPSVATQWLPPVLRAFVERHPGVEITVLAEDSAKVHRLVAEGEVDFGVSSLSEPDPKIEFQPLVQDRFGILCRRDHPLAASPRAVAWENLRGERILGNIMHRLLDDSPEAVYVARPRVHVSNLPTLLSLVREGLGVTPIPALAYPPQSGNLCFVPLVKPVRQRTIGLMRLAGRSLLPAAREFVDLLHARARLGERRPVKIAHRG